MRLKSSFLLWQKLCPADFRLLFTSQMTVYEYEGFGFVSKPHGYAAFITHHIAEACFNIITAY
jgi:hypothetical protein